MKVVFIAGPYGDHSDVKTVADNIGKAGQYAEALATARIGFLCPHLNSALFHIRVPMVPREFWLDMYLQLLTSCHAVLAIPGWRSSPGALREVEKANLLRMPVFEPINAADLDDIIRWAHGSGTDNN